ncbi:MAG: hypothetical protein ABI783_00470 [Actinomycetota bacterium]
MKINRYVVATLVGAGALLIGGGVAIADPGAGNRGARCEERLAKVAEERGVSVEQLQTDIKARLMARIDAAEKAGRISSERAAKLRERVSEANLCQGARHARGRIAARGMMRAAAEFLGLDREELREQLPGNSLADLAEKQGKKVADLKNAMLAPAKERLAKAVANDHITQARADDVLEKLEMLADKLVSKTFATR